MAIETSYSELQGKLDEYLDRVVDDAEVLYVRRPNGKNVAFISADELRSLLETYHVMSSPANAERLRKAIDDAEAGRLEPLDMTALRSEVGLAPSSADDAGEGAVQRPAELPLEAR
jgi:antitoxin YefM